MSIDAQVLYGLTADVIRQIQDVFGKYGKIDKVILYGSRAKGNFKIGSDIDLTIVGNLTLSELLKIENDLDDLLLPYKMDVSLLHQIQDDSLLDHISRLGKIFYLRG
jgi:predicted nucleotidyltransferase